MLEALFDEMTEENMHYAREFMESRIHSIIDKAKAEAYAEAYAWVAKNEAKVHKAREK